FGGKDPFTFLNRSSRVTNDGELLFDTDGERVTLMGRLPSCAVGGHGGERDGPRFQNSVGFGHCYGFTRYSGNFLSGHKRRGREAPCAAGDDAYTEAERCPIGNGGYFEDLARPSFRIHANGHGLSAIANDADI